MKSITKSVIFGTITVLAYLGIVVVTTPALDSISAMSAVIQRNSPIIIGMGIGVGVQSFLSDYSKKFGCSIAMKRRTAGGNSGSTVIASFFSFFSLIPLGCCGWWLYAISFLPSIFGTAICCLDQLQPTIVLCRTWRDIWIQHYHILQNKTKEKTNQDKLETWTAG